MIQISDCPVTGLQRKVDYNFSWLKNQRKIIINCMIFFYKDDVLVTIPGINKYPKDLIASDSLVNPITGHIYNAEELLENTDGIYEYDYYANVIGSQAIVLPSVIESVIMLRDSEQIFN